MTDRDRLVDAVGQLHDAVDALTAPMWRAHAERIRCGRGCAGCCVDELSVVWPEAERIRRRYPALLREAVPHPPGACAFLDPEGACRVYEARPYVCRTQGLPLRWVGADGERRDICELNEDAAEPIEDLRASTCWTLGPFEQRLAAWGEASGHPRVRLRDLFERSEP